MTALVFYFSFHFPDGYRLAARRRVAAVARDYWTRCGANFRWMLTPLKHRWQAIPDRYTIDQWLASYPGDDWAWSMLFHSGRVTDEAASYQIAGIGNSTETREYSNLYLIVPATWFAENPGQHPIALYTRWSEMMQARHGTAGLGLLPPEDTPKRRRTTGIAAAVRKECPGIELVDWLGDHNAFSGLLSPNWLNMIDTAYTTELGGEVAIRETLRKEALGSAVGFHPYRAGLILSSGEFPSLYEGDLPRVAPRAYQPVARLLKPLRTREPWGLWGCPQDDSLAWLARFD